MILIINNIFIIFICLCYNNYVLSDQSNTNTEYNVILNNIKFPVIGECCTVQHNNNNLNYNNLSLCIQTRLNILNNQGQQQQQHQQQQHQKNNNNNNNNNNNKINLITYADEFILPYASYSLAINSAYAEHYSIQYQIFSPSTGSNYEIIDARWNRVKILMNLFNNNINDEYSYNDNIYFVWLDADLIIIDFTFKFNDIINQYPLSDIIISSEWHTETGVANTGCFIIKKTEWSLNFLTNWWNNYDHSINHDQIFFSILYKSLLPESKEHISIISTEILNSIPSPIIYQKENHKILHLMGQKLEIRKNIFQSGWNELCQYNNNNNNNNNKENKILSKQLGLVQSFLYSTAVEYYKNELNNNFNLLLSYYSTLSFTSSSSSLIILTSTYKFEEFIKNDLNILKLISKSRENIIQMKYLLDNSPQQTDYILNKIKSIYDNINILFDNSIIINDSIENNSNILININMDRLMKERIIQLNNLCAVIGNDYFSELNSYNSILSQSIDETYFYNIQKKEILNKIEMCLLTMEKLVTPSSKVSVIIIIIIIILYN
jgi:hypothetical protein